MPDNSLSLFPSVVKNPWSDKERNAVFLGLGDYIRQLIVPKKQAIIEAKQKYPELSERSWLVIKSFVYNQIERRKLKL